MRCRRGEPHIVRPLRRPARPRAHFRLPGDRTTFHDRPLHLHALPNRPSVGRDDGQRGTASKGRSSGIGSDGESAAAPGGEEEPDHPPFTPDREHPAKVGSVDAHIRLERSRQPPRGSNDTFGARMYVRAATSLNRRVEDDLAPGDRQAQHHCLVVAEAAAHAGAHRAQIVVGLLVHGRGEHSPKSFYFAWGDRVTPGEAGPPHVPWPWLHAGQLRLPSLRPTRKARRLA